MSVAVPGVQSPAVAVSVPATWLPIDLDPRTREASIDRLLDDHPVPPDARSRARFLLRQTAESAWAAGASLAFLFVKVIPGGVASASLLVAVAPGPGTAEDPDDEVAPDAVPAAAVAEALAERYRGTAVPLAGLPAARVRRRCRVDAGDDLGQGGEAEVVTWYVPHETGRWIAVLTFSTPHVEVGDQFADAFNQLAGTARWTS